MVEQWRWERGSAWARGPLGKGEGLSMTWQRRRHAGRGERLEDRVGWKVGSHESCDSQQPPRDIENSKERRETRYAK
jgi:hypothetical protein